MLSGRHIFISTDRNSSLVEKHGIGIGERVRTPVGLAELRGVANNCLWFTFIETESTWFFSSKQIQIGRERGYFIRCSYELEDLRAPKIPRPTDMTFDTFFLQEIMDPLRWPEEVDSALVGYLIKLAEAEDTSVWAVTSEKVKCGAWAMQCSVLWCGVKYLAFVKTCKLDQRLGGNPITCLLTSPPLSAFLTIYIPLSPVLSCPVLSSHFLCLFITTPYPPPLLLSHSSLSPQICEGYRGLQAQLSRIVMNDSNLSHRWGISGPKRKATIARLGE